MIAHRPGSFVGGLPSYITLVNDQNIEHDDMLWFDTPPFSNAQLLNRVDALLETDDITTESMEQIEAAFKYQIAIEEYDKWWRDLTQDE